MGEGHDRTCQARAATAHFISRQGRHDEATELFAQARAAGNDQWSDWTHAILAFLHGQHLLRAGDVEEAMSRLREAERLFDEVGAAQTVHRGVWDVDAVRVVMAEHDNPDGE